MACSTKSVYDGEFNLKSTTISARSVQFDCSYEGVTLSVDLSVSPYWEYPSNFYHFLRGTPKETHKL